MAIQDSDGKYIGAEGTKHDNATSAAATRTSGGSNVQFGFVGGLAGVGVKAMFLGLAMVLILMAVAGLRAVLILAKTFWLYSVVLLLGLIAFIFILAKLRNNIVGLFAFILICVLGSYGATSYYKNSDMVFASEYSVDYIQALSNGNAPLLYEKMDNKGKVIAELTVNEKVTVNGVNLRRNQFNITTAEGKTGWVELAAFPENANEMLSINIGTDGVDTQDIAIDRKVEQLMTKYLEVDRNLNIESIPTDFYKMPASLLNRSLRINTQAPLLTVERKALKKGAELSNTGVNIILENIYYADDCTILYLTVTDPKIWTIAGDVLNTNEWKKALTVKDLDTGSEYPLMQAKRYYHRTYKYEQVGNNYVSSIVYFFPPFKSRHFSLTFNGVSPAPDKNSKTGYGGILGLMSDATGLSRAYDYFFDWNFSEVRIRN